MNCDKAMTISISGRWPTASLLTGALLALTFLTTFAAQAGTFTTIYNFTGGSDGAAPSAGVVVGTNGVLYGTTWGGGLFPQSCINYGCGTVFSLTPPASPGGAWTENVLHAFTGTGDGWSTYTGVVMDSAGALYGTTPHGGTAAMGSVYQLIPPTSQGGAWTYSILYSLQGAAQGSLPIENVTVGPNGVVYSTAYDGGTGCASLNGCGTAFQLTPPSATGGAWTFSTIYNFTSPNPYSTLLIAATGTLYGTSTQLGYKYGASFELLPPASSGGAWTENVIAKFGTSGPDGQIMGPSGEIYGVTEVGGKGYGVIYELTPPAAPGGSWSRDILYQFPSQPNFIGPVSLVAGPGGVVYVATNSGGKCGGNIGCGTLFSLTPPAAPGGHWTHSLLYNFTGANDSAYPTGLTIDKNGVLYGTCNGVNTDHPTGTVFQYVP